MCGRLTLRGSRQEIARTFDLLGLPDLHPLFNIAPSRPVVAVREPPLALPQAGPAAAGPTREFVFLQWGLVPSWADDPSIGNRLINARGETVDTKPAFRQAFRQRRCLIVADGFYEWQKRGRRKQPFHIRFRDGRLFGIAGLWERWQRGEQTIESCTIVTTQANSLVAELHNRMPVLLDPADYDLWLDPAVQEPERLKPLLRPYASDPLVTVPVNPRMNSPQYDGPECLEEVKQERPLELFGNDD